MQKSAERERNGVKEGVRGGDTEKAKEICKRKRGKLQTLRQSSFHSLFPSLCLCLPLSLSPFTPPPSRPLSRRSASLTTYVMEINCLLYMSFSSAYSISLDEDELPVPACVLCAALGEHPKLSVYPVK